MPKIKSALSNSATTTISKQAASAKSSPGWLRKLRLGLVTELPLMTSLAHLNNNMVAES